MQETQLKCTKARNDYLLNLAAANAAMNKYYLQDVCTLIDVRGHAHTHARTHTHTYGIHRRTHTKTYIYIYIYYLCETG